MRVLIIGGGLGGLTLTHGLRNSGIDVAVHERSHGNRALHACLPEESWRAYDQTSVPAPNVVRFRDTDLDTLTELQLSAPAEEPPPTRATCSSAPTAATPASRLSDVVVLTAMPSATRRRTRVSRAADVQDVLAGASPAVDRPGPQRPASICGWDKGWRHGSVVRWARPVPTGSGRGKPTAAFAAVRSPQTDEEQTA